MNFSASFLDIVRATATELQMEPEAMLSEALEFFISYKLAAFPRSHEEAIKEIEDFGDTFLHGRNKSP